jgi:general secretion pathway protein A
MYEQFFGLRERPFDLTSSPRYLALTKSHREVLLNLEDGMGSRKGITLLVGEAGSGKSTLIRAAIARLPVSVHCLHLHNPALTRSEFVETLAAHCGLSEAASRSRTTLLFELQRMFFKRRSLGETTTLVVDEAQSLQSELLEEIRLLANIEPNSEPRMRVVIAGQPELADRLNSAGLQQLKQRITLRCEVRPLGAKETAAYVAGRIRAAGGAGGQVFTREAVALICKHSRGFPRLINVIADNALLGGFAAGQRPVGSDIVREICGDSDIEAASASPVPATADVDNGHLFGAFAATPALSPISSQEDVGTVAPPMGPPASDTPKTDALWQPDDREIQEIFFNTYFEKVWSGPR